MTEAIPLFRPAFRVEETLAAIRDCLERGWTGLGYQTVEFEQDWCRYTGLPRAHFLNSATAGLHLAIRLLKERDGWADGDEIITTPLTFVSTNHAILYERLTPVFADVDRYLCLDPDSLGDRMTHRTRAVMFVGLGGNVGQLATVADFCKARNLRLILDAAHLAGTRLGGRHVGAEADATIFSFQAVKNLPTADAGVLCLRDPELDTLARRYSWLGIDKDTYSRTQEQTAYQWYYNVDHVGFKYHGNSVVAAIARVALRYLDTDNAYRRQLAAWYDEHLAGEPGIQRIPVAPGCESSRHLYQILVPRRDEVMLALNDLGIHPGVHYRDNIVYPMYRYAEGTCPRARRYSDALMSLPMHLRMTRADTIRVADAVRTLVARMTDGR